MNTVKEASKADTPRVPRRAGVSFASHWAAELRILLVAVLLAAYFEFANRDFRVNGRA